MALTTVQQVQLRIGDVDGLIFTSDQINDFLTEASNDIYVAAADACRSISASATLLARAVKIGNYSLDRKGMAAAYLKLAASLEEKSATAPASGIIEQSVSPFAARRIVLNRALRGL